MTKEQRDEIEKKLASLDKYDPITTKHWMIIRTLLDINQRLTEATTQLLQRIDANGGIGEYTSGPAFVVKRGRDALAFEQEKIGELLGQK